MYISSVDGRTNGFGKWSQARASEIDKDVRADEGDGEIAADPDLNMGVVVSPDRPHRPWLVPGAGRL